MTARFLIAAAHKSSGKTTVSIGLASALRARGLDVQPYKKGPDYIDPIWLGMAAGRACRNLDFNLSSADELREQFARHGAAADVCLVEGNKGLHDGMALDGSDSNAALARLLDVPVVLLLDARGMTRGVAPLILGYQAFDRAVRFAGVILNKTGGARHEAKLRAVVEHYTDLPVIGAIPADPRMAIAERHLGLMPANETRLAEDRIAAIAGVVAEHVDLDRLLAVTAAPPLIEPNAAAPATRWVGEADAEPAPNVRERVTAGCTRPTRAAVRLAIARDAAFGFYYPDDLDALRAAGAELIFFDALRNRLPSADGLFIGGGFPECFMDELEANRGLREDIRRAVEDGLPVYAECGGLMYLSRSLTWKGRTRQMVGVIAGDAVMADKPVGRGLVQLAESADHPWPGAGAPAQLRAHEFHYSSLENLGPRSHFAYRMLRGHGIDGRHDGLIYRNVLASYTHLRSTAGYDWTARFVAFVEQCREARQAALTAAV